MHLGQTCSLVGIYVHLWVGVSNCECVYMSNCECACSIVSVCVQLWACVSNCYSRCVCLWADVSSIGWVHSFAIVSRCVLCGWVWLSYRRHACPTVNACSHPRAGTSVHVSHNVWDCVSWEIPNLEKAICAKVLVLGGHLAMTKMPLTSYQSGFPNDLTSLGMQAFTTKGWL